MADSFFDAASTQLDAQKRGLLTAIAQAGTEGRQRYEAEQAQLAAERQSAVQAALAGAAQRNAPQALQDQIGFQIAQPYDNRASQMNADRTHSEDFYKMLAAANETYFDQAKGAIPTLRTVASSKAQDAALDRQLKELEIQKKMLDLQDAQSSPLGGKVTESERKRLHLIDAKNYVEANGGSWGHKGTTGLLDKYDEELGLPPGYTRSLLPRAKAASSAAKPSQTQRRTRTTEAVARKHGMDSKLFDAFSGIVNNSKNYADAISFMNDLYAKNDADIRLPSGKGQLNKTLLTTYIRSYFS